MRSFESSFVQRVASSALTIVAVVAFWHVAAAQNGTWIDADGDGNWSDAANWTGGVIADGSGNTADFSTADLDPAVVNTNYPGFYRNAIQLDASRTIGNLIFGDSNNSSPGGYEVYFPAGGTQVLTLAGTTPTVTVNPLGPYVAPTETIDDVIIRPVLAGTNGLTKMGTGVLTLSTGGTTDTLTGGININQGTLRLRSLINGQAINIANGATLDTSVDIRNAVVGPAAHSINVASGATATIISNSNIGNISASGATLNVVVPGTGTSTVSANDNWAVNGSIANLNVSSANGGFFRLRNNGGNFVGTSFQNTAVNLDNVTAWTRTGSGGNTINLGSLSGTSTAILSGGGQGGGTVATYSIGSLNTDTEFAGTIDSTSAPAGNTTTNLGGINLLKVGTGKLTLSGTLSYQTDLHATVNRRGGVATVSAGTLALKNGAQFPAGITGQNTIVNVMTGATLDVSGSTLSGGYNPSTMQTTVGVGTIAGNYVHDDGILSPGDTIPGATGTTPTPTPTTAAGTLTFANNLSFNNSATGGAGGAIKFDISPSTASGNDLIQVNGATNLNGTVTLTPSFIGSFTTGAYTVINSTGGFTGNTSGWTVNWPGRGTAPTLSINGNSLLMTVSAGSTGNVSWSGVTDSTWTSGAGGALNWWNNTSNTADRFFDLDTATFGDTYGTTNTPVTNSNVTLNTTVAPIALNVNNSVVDYTISGAGFIAGGGGLTKTGSKTLNISFTQANTFTGAVAISGGGTINTGTSPSGLGTGVLNMSGGKVIAALGGSLANSSITVGPGTNTIEIDGNSATTFGIPVMTGASGTAVTVTTTAQGTLVDIGSISGFNGTLTISPDGVTATAMNARFNGASSGNANAALVLANGAVVRDRTTSAQTIPLGSLTGDSTTTLGGFQGGSTATVKTWQIGGLNTSTTFAGTISNGAGRSGGVDTVAAVALTKVGTGTLTLTGNNNYGGVTTVNGGTLLVNGTHVQDTSPTTLSPASPEFNPGDYAVNSGGTLGGTGTIGDGLDPLLVSINAGGTLAPGAGIGTLSVMGDVSFADSSAIFKVEADGNAATSDKLAVTGNLALNGAALMASLLAGALPTGPHVIATYTGTLTGTFSVPSGIVVNYGTGANSQITMTINSLSLPGDYNADGKVDAADYVLWRKSPSTYGGDPAGYNTWRSHYGQSSGAGTSLGGSAVPEPTTAALLLIGLASCCCRRRG